MSVLWADPGFLATIQEMQAAAVPAVSSAPAPAPAAPVVPAVGMAAAPAKCSIPVSDPKVEAIQKGLKKAGYDPGEIDGIMGKNTRAAIKQLQHDHRLPTTGLMDAKTQKAFGSTLVARAFIDTATVFAADVVQGMNETAAAAEKQKAADAAKRIADFRQRIANSRSNIQALQNAVFESNKLRESTSSWVTGPVHAYGGSWEQIEIADFRDTNILLLKAEKALADGNLTGAEELLRQSDGEYSKLNERFAEYGDGIQRGGDRVVGGLKGVKVGSAAVVGIVAAVPVAAGGIGLGMVGVAAVGGTVAGAQNLAQQASEVHYGLRDKINFKDLAVETVVGAVTSYFGGKLGNMVVEKLMGTAAAASLGRKTVATLVGDYLAGGVGGSANLTIQTLYHKAQSSGSDVTWGQFLDQLVDQFTDPSQVLTNIVLGHVSRAAGAQLGGAKKVSVGGGKAEASTGSRRDAGGAETPGNAQQSPEPPSGPKGGPPESSAGDTLLGHPGYPAVRPPAAPPSPPPPPPGNSDVSQPALPKKIPSRAEVEDAKYKEQLKAYGIGPKMRAHPSDGKPYTIDQALSQSHGRVEGKNSTLMKVIWRDSLGNKGDPPDAFRYGDRIQVNTDKLNGEQLQKYIEIDKARNPDAYAPDTAPQTPDTTPPKVPPA